MRFRFSPETGFLRELLREIPDRESIERIPRTTDWFDWDYFEEALFTTRVVPIAASLVGRDPSIAEILPERLALRILEEGGKAAARSLLKERELVRVTTAFEGAGVPALVLKGLPFGERYYSGGTLREVRDLDLLVPPELVFRGEQTLRDLGYSLFEGVHTRAYYRRHHFHVVYVRRGLGVDVVELHWNLLHHPGSLRLDTEALFRESRLYVFQGSPIRVLSPLDEIAFLCASFRMSQFASLKRLVDLERMARRLAETVSARSIVDRGAAWGIGEEVEAALYILDSFWENEGSFPGLEAKPRIRRFASRLRGSDFFGLRPGREIRLRLWSGFHFGEWRPAAFAGRLLVPSDDFQAKMYFSEPPKETGARGRRLLAGLVALADLGTQLVFSRFSGRG